MPFCAEAESRCTTLPGAYVAVCCGVRICHDGAYVMVVFGDDLDRLARTLDHYCPRDRCLDHGRVEGLDARGGSRVAGVCSSQIPNLLRNALDRRMGDWRRRGRSCERQ